MLLNRHQRKLTDKGKTAVNIPFVLTVRVSRRSDGCRLQIWHGCLLLSFHLQSFPGEHFLVDAAEIQTVFRIKMRPSDRAEQLLNVADGQQVFVVVNKQQQQDVLLAVFCGQERGADGSWRSC